MKYKTTKLQQPQSRQIQSKTIRHQHPLTVEFLFQQGTKRQQQRKTDPDNSSTPTARSNQQNAHRPHFALTLPRRISEAGPRPRRRPNDFIGGENRQPFVSVSLAHHRIVAPQN